MTPITSRRTKGQRGAPLSLSRRRLLQRTGALVLAGPLATAAPAASAQAAPTASAQPAAAIPALTAFLAGRTPRRERLRLELPALADNGQAVPIRLMMAGPFAPGAALQSIHLFSEVNPVPEMAVFEFPLAPPRVEIESRVRLAGSQRVVAVALMGDGALYVADANVVVTIAACLDGS